MASDERHFPVRCPTLASPVTTLPHQRGGTTRRPSRSHGVSCAVERVEEVCDACGVTNRSLSEHAAAVLEVLIATAEADGNDRLVSREPLYRFLLDRFDIPDPQSRRVRTAAVHELTDAGLVRRHGVRGPRVEVLAALGDGDAAAAGGGSAPEPAVTYEEFAAAVERDTDAAAEGRRRVEQAFLRRFLLAGRVVAPCAFCGQSLPAGLLIAAHVKRRAELAHKQRLAFDQVAVLACTLGCDSLYEQGYVAVDPGGALTVATDVEPAVAERLGPWLDGLSMLVA